MYDKMPCGNTQAESDRDVDIVEDDNVDLSEKAKFVSLLMNNESYLKPSFSGGIHFNQEYTLNDALSSIDENSELWGFFLEDKYVGVNLFGSLYDIDPDDALRIISIGLLPTNLEKIVKSAVEALADEVLGE